MAESKLAGLIGLPLDRVDGRLKVTGRATYAYEYAAQGGAAYGVIVRASIGKGRVARSIRVMQSARPACCSCSPRTMRRPKLPGVRSTCRTALRAQSRRSIPTRCSISASLSPSWSPKRSSRPLPPPRQSVSGTSRYRATTTCTRRARCREPGADQRRRGRRQRRRRFRIGFRQGAGDDRRELYHALSAPGANGAARDDGGVGGRDVDRPYVGAVDDKSA